MKLNKKDMAERIKEYQEIYPGRTLYFTEDGNCFLEKSPAIDHASKTKQKWYPVDAQLEITEKDEKDEISEDQARELLLQGDISDDMPYQLAKDFVRILKIESVSQKKDDLLVALEEYKGNLLKVAEAASTKTGEETEPNTNEV